MACANIMIIFIHCTLLNIFFIDDLIFVVPRFARKWNTIGGLREEKIEAFDNIGKTRIFLIMLTFSLSDF